MKRGRHAATAIAAAALIGFACPGQASDYFHECRSPDGLYEISDGTLYESKDTTRKQISYTVVSETVLSERRGHCIASGKTYEFEARSYVQTIRFTWNAQPVETRVLCELAADGLPAALSCEREVVTHETKRAGAGAPPSSQAPAGGMSLWFHNGSLMRLEASGADRRFVYERPRRGMIEAGAKPGDPVFVGRRDGMSYAGTAYIYSRACGRTPYEVTGTVAPDERSVDLEGQVPRLGPDCRPRSRRLDVLRFTLTGN